MQTNWEDRLSCFGKKTKKVKNTFFRHLIPYNPGLRIFLERAFGSNDGPIVLYTYARNKEDPWSRFEEKAKKVKKKQTHFLDT